MNLEEVLNYRRSVRNYDAAKPLDVDKVKKCIELATLAPNSSNMQLWEFYHIVDKEQLKKLSKFCFDQSATATAQQAVVFVTRRDLFRQRAKGVFEFEKVNIARYSPLDRQEKRTKDQKLYYSKVMPFMYAQFFGLLGFLRKAIAYAVHPFRTMITAVSESDSRIVVHKSCALAAQTFMIAMANEGYDTCPLEGFDGMRVKKLLGLPHGAEINMVISCGIRNGNKGIWGERYRVPFDEVYKQV